MKDEITSKYLDQLEELLTEVPDKLASKLSFDFTSINTNYDDIDDYILELNRFYYKTFHEKFFPHYRKTIINETEELLQIKRDQDMLVQDLLANIKRYAKLYNQVKIVNRLLANTREDFNNSLYTVYREKEYQNTELLYTLKELHNLLNSLQIISNLLTDIYDDKELINAIRLYPNMPRMLVKMSKLIPSEIGIIKRLIIKLNIVLKLIQRLQASNINKKIVQSILSDLIREINIINADRVWSSMPEAFRKDFDFKVRIFTELISSYQELNKLEEIRKLALEYENVVHSFLIVLDEGLDFIEKNDPRYGKALLDNAFAIIDLGRDSLATLNHNVTDMKSSLDRIQDSFTSAGNPDFSYLAKTIDEILNDYQIHFQQLSQDEDLMQISPLAKQLNRLNLEFSMLDRHLHLLKEKHEFSKLLETRYLEVINILDSYLSFTSNTRGDLERILAPRNLSRIWKGFNVKIDRLPTEIGKRLILDDKDIPKQAPITRQTSQLDTNVVLYEEGDIFIITVDEITTYEIPKIILAQEG
ncbi:MAG TPA: hypothetical protein VFC73_04340 [Syntrophomonadaceae bacterium]|nr:hypothetical protein [Syntrophomonadaceae bacterium]